MTFLVDPRMPKHEPWPPARALDAWREAEHLVQVRWETYLVADRASRRDAFAAYVAALDGEAAAAGDLSDASADLCEAA
jgi:hypothetical protein